MKPGGVVGIAGAGLAREIEGAVPDHLREFWSQDFWCLHSAAWWRRHWERTGLLEITVADEGWQLWLDWHKSAFPDNASEIKTLEADRGEYLGYVRVVGRRRGGTKLEDYCWPGTMKSAPPQDTRKPLLRGQS